MKLRGALARQGKVVASVEHLHLVAQQMYLATDSVFDSQDEADWNGTATSSLAHVMPEEMLAGKFIEVKSCTLLYCGFQEARRAMWQRMFNQQQQTQHQQHCDAVSSESSAMERRELTSEGFEKCYDLVRDLHGLQQQAIEPNGTSHIPKFAEVDRYLIM
ncbi:hypothetical protein Gpo141_00003702 [Globisporangium polare]